MTKEEKLKNLLEFIDSELKEKENNPTLNKLWSVLRVIKVSLENL